MKLYGLPGACSLVDHIALNWIGKPFEYISVARDALKVAPYINISPLGAVPAIDDDGFTLTQNIAILEYLAEKNPEAKLLGGESLRARSEARRWLGLFNSDVHKTFSIIFGASRLVTEKPAQDELAASASARVRDMFFVADKHLAGRNWLSDGRSVADAYLYVTTRWAKAKNVDLTGMPNLEAHFQRMSSDPAVQAALGAEGLK
ncbi:MAG: glutathione S-transferase [Alcaligenaceae bacterium]|nr:MAG: glutathione S-transferase [Alcaligenaceae bacterium]